MRFIDLKYIQTVAIEGNISKAASKLYISQPSLSNAIKKIETDLGASIFFRTKNGLVLTQVGNKYFNMANNILKIYADFENELSEIDQMTKGKISFGITNYVGSMLLPNILPEFENIAPNIDLSFVENHSHELLNLLKLGKIDFAVMHIEPSYREDLSVEFHSIIASKFLLAVSKNHPCSKVITLSSNEKYPSVDLEVFREERFILTDYDQMSRNIAKRIFKSSNFTPQKTLVTRNLITATRLASKGFGVTFFPEMYMEFIEDDSNLNFYNVCNTEANQWELVVATLSQNYLPKSTEYLINLIHKQYK